MMNGKAYKNVYPTAAHKLPYKWLMYILNSKQTNRLIYVYKFI